MQGFKKYYFNFFKKSITQANIDALIAKSGVNVIFPFYHIVSDKPVLHIQHLYPIKNAHSFIADLDFLLQHFKPLSIDDYCNDNYNKSDNYFVLSFDDGLREMYEVVKPILLEKNIPATFFLNTDFIDNKGLFYRYKISILLETVNHEKLSQCITANLPLQKVKIANPAKYLKQLTWNDIALIDKIAVSCNVDFADYLTKNKPYLTTEQIHDLVSAGFNVGAHSLNHPLYSSIDPQIQFAQTRDSMQYITEHFHQLHNYFAFPFTSDGVVKELFDAMYTRLGINLSFGTAGIKKQIQAKHIERIPAEKDKLSLQQIVKHEFSYFQFKRMLGR